MKIIFYSTKPYDRIWFELLGKEYKYEIHFLETGCTMETISLSKGYDAICIFVNDQLDKEMIDYLYQSGMKAILLRSAGFNHVDLKAANGKIPVLRVPNYSPESVAEHTIALLLSINRQTHRAYNRTRDFNMNINGLMGKDLINKKAGIIGTGKIGQATIKILKGFGMKVMAYDPYPNNQLDVIYTSLDEIFEKADVISLHCPLTEDTKYVINKAAIERMKKGVFLVNTSRGGLINTSDLIDGLLDGKFGGVGLDVYEEEEGIFFEDLSNEIVKDQNLVRLASFPNVLITSHMGFFTKEAMQAIAIETLENAYAIENNLQLVNEVKYQS